MKKRHSRKRNNPWRRARRPHSAGDGLRLFALAAVIALLAWVGVCLTPPVDAGAGTASVVIERVMTSNPDTCYSVDGKYYDWVELRNRSDEAVSLAGWRLGDSVDLRPAFDPDGVYINELMASNRAQIQARTGIGRTL